jgi:hypothetical protein
MHQITKSTNRITTGKGETLNARRYVNALKSSAYSCFSLLFVVLLERDLTRPSLGNYNFENRKREKPPNIIILYLYLRPQK